MPMKRIFHPAVTRAILADIRAKKLAQKQITQKYRGPSFTISGMHLVEKLPPKIKDLLFDLIRKKAPNRIIIPEMRKTGYRISLQTANAARVIVEAEDNPHDKREFETFPFEETLQGRTPHPKIPISIIVEAYRKCVSVKARGRTLKEFDFKILGQNKTSNNSLRNMWKAINLPEEKLSQGIQMFQQGKTVREVKTTLGIQAAITQGIKRIFWAKKELKEL